jgi:hypothetical protein
MKCEASSCRRVFCSLCADEIDECVH